MQQYGWMKVLKSNSDSRDMFSVVCIFEFFFPPIMMNEKELQKD
jgi:hypothetical protein